MDDAEYVFKQDCKEKALIGKSSQKKKTAHKGCRLPSDNMSKKEREEQNGAIQTYALGKPMDYRFFKAMPVDLQKEYILRLRTIYEARETDIAEMFSISASSWSRYRTKVLPDLIMTNNGSWQRREKSEKWIAFMHSGEKQQIIQAAESGEVLDGVPVTALLAPAQEPEIMSGSLTLSGFPEECFRKVLGFMDSKRKYKISVSFQG